MFEHPFTQIHLIGGVIITLFYISLLIIERVRPLRKQNHPFKSRLFVNIMFSILVYISASLMISPVVKYTLDLNQTHGFGILSLLPFNNLFLFICGFLLMDLSFYYWHRLNHRIPLLWRFHNVHHVDPDLDVTTSMRFHWVEIAYSSIFRLIQLALIGVNPIIFFSYEFIFQACTFFHHSNVKLPIRFERFLNKILVTPRMHGIHHSDYRDETNSNYSIVFSFWDKLHRTVKLNIPQYIITIGVPGYQKPDDNTLISLLMMPFKTQHQYWQQKHLNRTNSQADEAKNHLSD